MTYDVKLTELIHILKPKELSAMAALYVASYVSSSTASQGGLGDSAAFLTGFAAVLIAVGGANALNCYLDRDVDAVMARTMRRPLPRGALSPKSALLFSLILLSAALVSSIFLGVLPFIFFTVGVYCYIGLYTILLKRRTSLNVFATAPSVASPAWLGWIMGGSPINFVALIIGVMIATWGLFHLWSLAYAFKSDYSKSGIPMLTAILPPATSERIIFASLVALVALSYILGCWAKTPLFSSIITIINALVVFLGLKFLLTPSRKASWRLFKVSAPYIIIILSIFSLDNYLFYTAH
ncbi:protoheme IX farnesyltransferase [Candidatus Bathyarchaeota archaeon]|nr:protoheme IX farnesyltransferase [Candidatus Bathyarchaeota archaeon]MBS7631320.1 protoheme IX farnesyltransferase [Candidatus Bathyarchaeota archaeon]